MDNKEIEKAVDNLIEVIKGTEEYIYYRKCYSAINEDDDAVRKVEKIQELNVRVQNMSEDEYNRESRNIYVQMDELCEDSRVLEFIQAEVDFAKIYQYITERIIDAIE